jgi:hypothetical protein
MTPGALHAEEQIQRTSDHRDLKSWLQSFFPATVSQGFGKIVKRLRRLGMVGTTSESIAFIAR